MRVAMAESMVMVAVVVVIVVPVLMARAVIVIVITLAVIVVVTHGGTLGPIRAAGKNRRMIFAVLFGKGGFDFL